MLNIFADALLLASRLGQITVAETRKRPAMAEFHENEGLRQSDRLRHAGR